MEIEKNQVFNLWDTNGRRHDVINAIEIYLRILQDLNIQYQNERWAAYPKSIKQYLFYKSAIEASPDVFQDHSEYDIFEDTIRDKYNVFFSKSLQLTPNLKKKLDKYIESKARHYTSSLVRLGFADEERIITEAGKNLINGSVKRDMLEDLLPITDTNLVLFRQLLKLKIYTKPDDAGRRQFYSPCLMALYALLSNESIDIGSFKNLIQGISPYWREKIDLEEISNEDLYTLIIADTQIPAIFKQECKISEQEFHIKNRKSKDTIPIYYTFYSALFDYVITPNEENYLKLREVLLGNDKAKIKKAFGLGGDIFKCGNNSRPFTLEKFIEENSGNSLLANTINTELYKRCVVSKYLDTAREYSDTTIRMLGATGLFQFSKPLVELSHKKLFQTLLSRLNLKDNIIGVVSQDEYDILQSDFDKEISLKDIFNFDDSTVDCILAELRDIYGAGKDIHSILVKENERKLENHIQEKYPKEKVVELLQMFSNRQNDKKIKQFVNKDATVPTIFEFIVAIAWYYISDKKISVYDSLNLTLNGDFEPIIHAGGGAGDIVVKYSDKIVMLEVTLMNAAAQKRGEWEPVLRHAINLTAESYPQKVFTLFVADTLDYNTINIWRAVAAVTLESSSTGEKTKHVVIMPFTNVNFCNFINNNVSDDKIIDAIKISYDEINAKFDDTWHKKIIDNINK